MFKRVIFILSISLFFFLPSPIFAEEISSFTSDISIHKDGTITVGEHISYDFGSEKRHGIFRKIDRIKENADGKKFVLDMSIVSIVDRDNKPFPYESTIDGNYLTIKIGDPDKTVTGMNAYNITYNVSGALTYFSDHDELYWNATGNEWEVPIVRANASVLFSNSTASLQFRTSCFTGSSGSTEQNCEYQEGNNQALFGVTQGLSPHEGLTIVAGFPKGIVAQTEPKEYKTFFDTFWGAVVIALIIVGAVWWYLLYPIWIIVKWWMVGRDPKVGGPVAAWYDPPSSKNGRRLFPAEAGTLIDETVNPRDISSTIVDLARRGYLKIEERKKNDFYFVNKNKPLDPLLPYEKRLFEGIFSLQDEVRLKDKKLVGIIEEVTKLMYRQVVDDGFFDTDPQKTKTFYSVIGGIALSTMNFPLALISFVFGRNMPKKTLVGAEQAMVARSLNNFLKGQERQLTFQAKNQMWFEKLLPYAVAFGVEKYWAEQFKNIALKAPEWFTPYGNRPFNSIYFANSLHSSMNSFESTVTPTRSSSGFSSGFSGGSSGGGGGGGGGGSW